MLNHMGGDSLPRCALALHALRKGRIDEARNRHRASGSPSGPVICRMPTWRCFRTLNSARPSRESIDRKRSEHVLEMRDHYGMSPARRSPCRGRWRACTARFELRIQPRHRRDVSVGPAGFVAREGRQMRRMQICVDRSSPMASLSRPVPVPTSGTGLIRSF